MASQKYVYPWWGRHPGSITWKDNWQTLSNQIPGKHEETRGKKRRKGNREKETE
jgi:hypothetical protein